MILYSELVKEEFTKLGKVIKRYNKLKKQKDILNPKYQKEVEEQVKQIKQQFDISSISGGGFFQPGMQISNDNKELLENGNVIKFTPGGFSTQVKFYQVKKNNNSLILIECNDDSIEITGTAADKILNSKNCEFVSNDNPDNNCKTLQKSITKIKNIDDFFYNILLRILINNKDEFLKCLRIKLSIILNKVLDKLYEISKSTTRDKLNSNIEIYTYSDKDNEIIKLTEKMFCITDFDLQPFRSIVELSLAKKHNQIEAAKAHVQAEAAKAHAQAEADKAKIAAAAKAHAQAEADRIAKEEDAKYEQITKSATYSASGIDYYVKNNGIYTKKGKAIEVTKHSFPAKLVFKQIGHSGNYFVKVSENCYVIKEELEKDKVKQKTEAKKGGKTKKNKNKRFLTRKSSSQVSRKTRRHKRTSR
jgi:hypothetical protein